MVTLFDIKSLPNVITVGETSTTYRARVRFFQSLENQKKKSFSKSAKQKKIAEEKMYLELVRMADQNLRVSSDGV